MSFDTSLVIYVFTFTICFYLYYITSINDAQHNSKILKDRFTQDIENNINKRLSGWNIFGYSLLYFYLQGHDQNDYLCLCAVSWYFISNKL